MLIQIVRSTLVTPIGELLRPVDAGEVVAVEQMIGLQLVQMGKAIALPDGGSAQGGIIQTPEDALTEMEIRPERSKGRKRR